MALFEQILKSFFEKLPANELTQIKNLIDKMITVQNKPRFGVKNYWNKGSNPTLQKLILPPSIPSRDDIKIYKNFFLAGEVKKSVLLLGSTPSLRDMLSNLNVKDYVVADFSFLMLENAIKLTNSVDEENEIWIKSEWSKLPLPPSSFDCILGDLVFLQMPPQNQKNLLKKISFLLRRNGVFITRTHVVNTTLKDSAIRDLIDSTNPHVSAFRLWDKFRNNINRQTSPQTIIETLAGYAPRDEAEKEMIEKMIKIFAKRAENNFNFIAETKNEFESEFSNYFVINNISYAGDYADADYFPIYSSKLPTQTP